MEPKISRKELGKRLRDAANPENAAVESRNEAVGFGNAAVESQNEAVESRTAQSAVANATYPL